MSPEPARLADSLRAMIAAIEGPTLDPSSELGVYRALVRGNLRDVIRLQLGETRALVGDALLDAEIDAFVDAGLPRSHYLRDVPQAFLAFLAPRWRARADLPAHALDRARYELLEYEVAAAWEDPALADTRRHRAALELDRPVVWHASLRFARFEHPVHDPAREGVPASTALIVYRDAEHELHTLELSPLAADMVERLVAGEPLGRAIQAAAAARGAALDATTLAETSALLADYAARGILLGCLEAHDGATPIPM